MQKTVTGTTMMMMRASGSTTPRWTLTMVVVVLKASINPVNATHSLREPAHPERFGSSLRTLL